MIRNMSERLCLKISRLKYPTADKFESNIRGYLTRPRAAPVGRSAVSVALRADSRKAKCRLLGASSVVARVQPGRRAFVTRKSWRDKVIMCGARAHDTPAVSDTLLRRHICLWSSGEIARRSPGDPTHSASCIIARYTRVCVWVLAAGGNIDFRLFSGRERPTTVGDRTRYIPAR